MPLRNRVQYRYSLDIPTPPGHAVPMTWVQGFVDMLRVEGCTVDKFDGLTVQLVSPRQPELRRWRSFGIAPYMVRSESLP